LLSTNGAQVIRNVVIPSSPVLNTSLRMRVISDVNTVSGSCHTSTHGQTEDYTIMITSASLTASVSIASSDADNSICNGGSVTFTATPVNGGSTPVYQWKIGGVNAGTNSPTFSTTGLSTGQVVTCELTSNLSNVQGSPATSTGITTTVNSTSAPTGAASLSFCTASTVANLTATGTAIKWYKSLTGGTALAYNSSLSNGANYYASQTNSGCESSARLQVAVSIYAVPVVSISAIPSVCSSASPITLTQGLPIGGTYSGNGITNGLLNPSGLPVGFTTVTYSYTNVYLCSATAQTTVLINQCVGLVENEKLPISLFPNPTNGVLYINNLDERISEIRLIDNLGRIVLFEKNEMETSIVLDLSPFESGMYTIQFNSDVESFKSKIIIQK